MQLWDFTDTRIATNLALDEALIEEADVAGGQPVEVLRIWESTEVAVILGRSSKVAVEADEAACRAESVSILRRCSGGAAVVVGPGCLMYSLLISLEKRPACRSVSEAHCLVMTHWRRALEQLGMSVRHQGSCDLTWDDRKFSGNSLRCKRRYLLYHGTLLYDFDLDRIERLLKMPPRQPDYRQQRSHSAFVTNLPQQKKDLVAAFTQQWEVTESFAGVRAETVDRLLSEKYENDAWHYRH